MLSKIKSSLVYRSSRVLSSRDRFKVIVVICLQIFFGFLDLAGVAIIGVLGALAVTGIQSSQPGDRVNSILSFLSIENQSLQYQVGVLGIIAAVLLISRTIFSVIFTRRILHFLSQRCAVISKELTMKILSQDLLSIRKKTIQETVYTITTGVNSVVLGIIGVTVNLFADVSLLIVLSAGLLLIDPLTAIFAFIVFASIAVFLYRILNSRAQRYGRQEAALSVQNNEKIVEVLESYRELYVRNRRSFYANQIGAVRADLSHATAELSFLPFVTKYIIETAMVVIALVICAIQFQLQDAVHAVASLSVFLAAGTRIVPAILRVQQAALSVKGSVGSAGPTLDEIETLIADQSSLYVPRDPQFKHEGFQATVEIQQLTFSYTETDQPTLFIQELKIPAGTMVAVVGPSGAGKTTLVDLILGVFPPSSGEIRVSGVSPREAIEKWPGSIGYVPQDVVIANGTIRSNVELGFEPQDSNTSQVERAITDAHLGELVRSFDSSIDESVGEKGSRLSGGERQRLGIARALFTNPEVLILDEATSALDAATEELVSKTILGMKSQKTVILIAHRLSTVLIADLVLYLENGRVRASGTFDEVRAQVPDFDANAKLLGIS
jgi:ABC-type multidrug transport system fused ATPase/permease subunit